MDNYYAFEIMHVSLSENMCIVNDNMHYDMIFISLFLYVCDFRLEEVLMQ